MLFTTNPNIYLNAYPNWQKSFREREEYFNLFARNFKETADKLIDSIGENSGHIADKLINPALYLYRHSIELSLKGVLYPLYIKRGVSEDKIQKKLDCHDLVKLWDRLYPMMVEELPHFKSNHHYKNELKKMHKSIVELNSTDPGSFNYRYPFDTKLVENIYGDGRESYGFDYIYFKKGMSWLYDRFEYWIYESIREINK